MKREIILLTGLPSTGKSTHTKEKLGGADNNYIISRDKITELVAKEANMYYAEFFVSPDEDEIIGEVARKGEQYGIVQEKEAPEYLKLQGQETVRSYSMISEVHERVTELFTEMVNGALKQTKPIIVDMKNITKVERAGIVSKIRGDMDETKFREIFDIKVVNFIYDMDNMGPLIDLAAVRHEEIESEGVELGEKLGKPIVKEVYEKMVEIYETPTEAEGFDDILNIDTTRTVLWLLDLKAPEKAAYYLNPINPPKNPNISPK